MPIGPNTASTRPERLAELEEFLDKLLPSRKHDGVAVIKFKELAVTGNFSEAEITAMSSFVIADYLEAKWKSVTVEIVPDGRDMRDEPNVATAFIFKA